MRKILIANQKAYLDDFGLRNFLLNFPKNDEVIFCPSSLYFKDFLNASFNVGAQNMALDNSEAQTGELTAKQLLSLGIHYVIVGHSERRLKQKESDEEINLKLKHALANNMTPILCIGESKEEYEAKQTQEVLRKQLETNLAGLSGGLIIAYEPIWAIGSGYAPTNTEIEEVSKFIKDYCKERPLSIKLLYGGSVKASNIDELNQIENVDGYLAGGASANVDEFTKIVKSCQ